ncbi:unnamed protein product [Echinostoma caproni]|uniref:Uncharacterized protein n=1 Tax=Echinostoma caproni TaxID=27848 RepID=A0A183ATU0_9TREM|nr:unnamed protein product [Echinostoma caproni]
MTGQISPYATTSTGADLRRPITEAYAAMVLEPRSPKLPPIQGSVPVETSVAATLANSALLPPMVDTSGIGGSGGVGAGYPGYVPGHNEGFISTQVNSGTSTFRRRQSEYAKRHPPDANSGLGHTSRIMNFASATPAVVRRGSQVCPDASGRNLNRPTNPPRRSSSVSREFNHARHSVMPEPMGGPFFTSAHPNGGVEHPGIQRVSSSIFTHADQSAVNHAMVTNAKECWPTASVHDPRPNLIQLPPGTMIKPSVAISATAMAGIPPAYYSEAPTSRGKGMPLTPPPLATVAAPTHSKTNQLMFGVKVLPSQIPALPHDQAVSQSAMAQHYGTINRQIARQRFTAENPGGHYASASRLHRTPAEDGSTSFIE